MLVRALAALFILSIPSFVLAQDTITVQTLTFDSIGRAGFYQFPQINSREIEKVVMQYSMRCKDGLVSTGSDRNKGCGEWDYNCETYITDSTRIDSVLNEWPSAIISGFTGTVFPFVDQPTNRYIKRKQYSVTYSGAGLTEHSLGKNESHGLTIPVHPAGRSARIISRFKDWELKDAGLSPGSIYSMKVSAATSTAMLDGFKIRMRRGVTSGLDLDTGWTEVYSNAHALQTSSENRFNFYRPFNWTGDDLEVELSYTGSPADVSQIAADTTSFPSTRTASTFFHALEFSGSEYFDVSNERLDQITDEISVGMWLYGAPSKGNPSSTIMEGTDGNGHRTFNLHLPWDNGEVYFDCGNGTGYDRINTAVKAADVRGRWNHWMFTKNSKTGVMSMYLNGSPIRVDTGRRRMIEIRDLRFGNAMLSNHSWSGQATKLTIHKKALDSIEINKIIDGDQYYGDAQNRIAMYPLSNGIGQQLPNVDGPYAMLQGTAVWRERQGFELQRGFTELDRRPVVSFYQSAAPLTPSIIQTFVVDTIAAPSRRVRYYEIVANDLVRMTDSGYVWPAGKQYMLDEHGAIVDSFVLAPEDSIEITLMPYFTKSPQKFEIMSFVTPYGIGLDLGMQGKMWQFDVTDYLPILNGMKRLSVERGAWQEELDIRFLFVKGTPTRPVLDVQQLWPATEENYTNIRQDKRFQPIDHIPSSEGKMFKIRSMITGHGQEGEFIARDHTISVNGQEFTRQVWKQCSENPVYPQGGTWIYARAGWCPGMATDLAEYDVTSLITQGELNSFDYTVRSGSGDSRYVVNNQIVTYGLPSFTRDAAVVEVRRPSDRVEFARYNPAATQPVVAIRNNGSAPLTSLRIEYGVTGASTHTYEWTGNLAFLDTQHVTLPTPTSWGTEPVNTFVVTVSQPNGETDEYARNNTYVSRFERAPVYSHPIIVRYRTNRVPEQNYYEIRNAQGAVVHSNFDALDASTTYFDSLTLAPGNYTFTFYDDGENGIEFWAAPNDGNGTLAFRRNRTVTGNAIKTFDPDFGRFTQHDFTVEGTASVDGHEQKVRSMRVYPNPAQTLLKVDMMGYDDQRFSYDVLDVNGRSVLGGEFDGPIDISQLLAGSYSLVLTGAEGTATISFIKE